MCGILGLHLYRSVVDLRKVELAVDSLRSRGPDDSGIWAQNNIALGHRRLAVQDLSSAGHQPMTSSDGRYTIVFNGEVYNFRELRQQLAYPWISASDTEVVLAAYQRWGVKCVEHFKGMFAFAIWDNDEKSLYAATDRLSVKPFYYHHSDDGFLFASRPKALCILKKELFDSINSQSLRFYLECGYIPAPHTIHPDLSKLAPGHYLVHSSGNLTIKRYWDFSHIEPDATLVRRSEDDLLDELDEVILRSVQYRMVSDAPLGAFLSGGIDSSVVAAVMAKQSGEAIKTFTIGFDEKQYDESGYARDVARHLKTEHYEEKLKVDDLLALLPTFSEAFDEPFFDSAAFPTMAVSRLSRKHVTVTLSGDGGDELFGGYRYYKIAHAMDIVYRNLPVVVRRRIAAMLGIANNHKVKLLSYALSKRSALEAFLFSRSIQKDYGSLLHENIRCETKAYTSMLLQDAEEFSNKIGGAEACMRHDLANTLPFEYLPKLDLATMAFSLEAREPMLDHNLVEWAMKLPLCWKIRRGETKYLLKRLAYRYIPKELLNRPKKGFTVPIDVWLRGSLKNWAEERIYDRARFEDLSVDQSKVIALWKVHVSGKRNAHPILWAVLMLLNYNEAIRNWRLAP